jgi:DNA replication protein DnaC
MEDIKFFKIYLEDSIICTIKCARSETLDNLRKKISLKISNSDFLFTLDNDTIEEQNEKGFTVDDITKENAVKLIFNNSKNNGAIPIPGSIEKFKIDNTTIYSYPEYKLTEIEKADETNTKNILLIGKSGDGKTTFLNALINVLANIKGEDKIRYKLAF